MRVGLLLLLCVIMCGSMPLAGVEAHPDIPVIKDAKAVLRVNDAVWIDREVTQLATAYGEDPGPSRDRLARVLFFTGSMAAIDLQRPSLVAWRDGTNGLLAVIPILNRQAFLDTFGELPSGTRPLIRVGEQEGTVLYSRNLPDQREDYRLLISNDTGYLAHTLEECRALASVPLRLSGDDLAISYSSWGPYSSALETGVPISWPEPLALLPPSLDSIASLVRKHVLPDLFAALASWHWQVHEHGTAAELGITCDITPDSGLSQWLRMQTPQALALPESLPAECLLRLTAAPTWQGQCEAEGESLRDAAKQEAGANWSAPVEEAWRSLWTSADHVTTLGLGLALPAAGQPCWLLSAEHPQADFLTAQVATLVAGWQGRKPAAQDSLACVVAGAGAQGAVAATQRQLLIACGPDGKAAPLATSAQHPGAALGGPSGLAYARMDFTRMVRAAYASGLDADSVLPEVALEALATGDKEQIKVVMSLPVSDICTVLNKVSWK